MKPLLLLLLPLLLKLPAAGPPAVKVTFSPLTKAAYLQALKQSPGFGGVMNDKLTFPVKKQQHKLVIPTATGNKVFRDKIVADDEAAHITYSYLGFLPKLRQHVVEVAYWENTDWLIIEENGNMVRLVSPPNYSPNRQNILAGSCGIEYEMAPNRVQVFKTKNNKLALAWEITPELWEPTEAFWGNDSTVFVKQKWFKYNGTSVDRYRVGYKPSRFTYSRIVVK